MKKIYLLLAAITIVSINSFAQTSYSNDFEGATLDLTIDQGAATTYTATQAAGVLTVTAASTPVWAFCRFTLPEVLNLSTNSTVTLTVTSNTAGDFRFDFFSTQSNDHMTDKTATFQTLTAGTATDISFDFDGKFTHTVWTTPDGGTTWVEEDFPVDNTEIAGISIVLNDRNGNAAPIELIIDDLVIGGTVAAIEDVASKASVYPNPASDVVTVAGAVSITIVDLTGAVVATATSSSIDVSGLASGLYAVQAIAADGAVSMAKVVVE